MRRRILLADDSVTIQKVIELTFLDEDYEVKAVSNGDEAIAALPLVNPDFVIADVHMPGANGYEVCRRSKEHRPDIPVLLLVGTFEPFDEGQSRAVGADSFLKKPFDSQELLQRVEELLAARSAASSPPAAPAEYSAPATDWGSFQVEPPPVPVPDPLPAPTAFTLAENQPFTLEEDRPFTLEEDRPFTLDDDQPFTLEEERPFAPPGESSFDESPFLLDEEPLKGGVPAIDESALLPAGEPLFDLESTASDLGGEPAPLYETPSFEEPYPSFETPSFDEVPALETPSFEPPFSPSETVRVDTRDFQVPGFAATPEAPHEPAPAAAPVAAVPAAAVPVAAVPAAPVPIADNGGGPLSDEDVDRIARRVVELMADRAIRDVAWEVIPDMAEMVIRDRLRELESQAESFE